MKAPVNTKSLFHFIMNQMEGLSNGTISVEDAKTQANLAKQAHNILKYEIERSQLEMEMRKFNMMHGANVELRQVESKSFDNTMG
jgi:hypothetical protein